MEVLIVGPNPKLKGGGIATHIRNLLQYESLKNAEIIDVGSLTSEFEERKIGLKNFLKNFTKLKYKLSTDQSIALVNSSLYVKSVLKLWLIVKYLSKEKKGRLYIFFHGGNINTSLKILITILKIFNKKLMLKVDCYYFLTENQKSEFEKLFIYNKTAIYQNYSVSNELIKTKCNKRINFLFVGRLDPAKGVWEAVEAVKQLHEENFEFTFTIVGIGKLFNDLKDFIDKNDLFDRIIMKGYLSGKELIEEYQNAHVVLLPSYQEAFPYVYIEAMQAGIPIIATPVGALERLIQENYNGFFIKSKNVESIKNKIRYFLENNPNLNQNCHQEFINNLSRAQGEEFYLNLISKIV